MFKVFWNFPIIKLITMVFFIFIHFFTSTDTDELKDLGYKDSSSFGVFYSLQTILDTLDEKRYQNKPKVHQLLSVFETHCKPRDNQLLSPRRPFPFIVIEGSQRTGRRILGKVLAKSIGARVVVGIPRCLIKLRHKFDSGESELKRTFFGLSNYITAFNVRHMLEDTPVVLIGYWMDQATFNIAKEFPTTLPPKLSLIYKFPADLLSPDVVFYLNTPREELQSNLLDVSFNRKIMKIYRRMKEPEVIEVKSKYFTNEFISELRTILREKLQDKYPHLVL